MTTQPNNSKDWEAYLRGHRAGHLDRRIGVKLMQHFADTYQILNPYALHYGEGYRKGWCCSCND